MPKKVVLFLVPAVLIFVLHWFKEKPPEYTIEKPSGWHEFKKKEGAAQARIFFPPDPGASVSVITVHPIDRDLLGFADYMEEQWQEKTGAPVGTRILDFTSRMDGGLPRLVREYAVDTDGQTPQHMRFVYVKWKDRLYVVMGAYDDDSGHETAVRGCLESFGFAD